MRSMYKSGEINNLGRNLVSVAKAISIIYISRKHILVIDYNNYHNYYYYQMKTSSIHTSVDIQIHMRDRFKKQGDFSNRY